MKNIPSIRYLLQLIVGAASISVFSASAGMTVYPMETAVGETGSAQIRVMSQDDKVQFIRITVKKITEPGTKNEKEIPAGVADQSALVVTPQKLALTPGGERIVRLVSLFPPTKEATWRVYFESVSEEVFDGHSQTSEPVHSSADVGVSVVWGALIHVAPVNPWVSLKYKPASDVIINEGTVRVPIKEIATCNSGNNCVWKTLKATIYPSTEVHLPKMILTAGKTYRIKYFDWIKNSNQEIELPATQVK
ncbi:fimbrial protein [Rahnella ecdela]|uniref:Fimbrial protein n=1 Tax=Rahnella ecdela TaxID=2816250 RepID=A0ABS6LCV3_9GAMM|nr:fimbrial protein [Rahnella ecdela]MBU9844766.1 fimbrial protein [Rahnella ecdela]